MVTLVECGYNILGKIREHFDPVRIEAIDNPQLHATIQVTTHLKSGRREIYIKQEVGGGVYWQYWIDFRIGPDRRITKAKGIWNTQEGPTCPPEENLTSQQAIEIIKRFNLNTNTYT